MSQNIGATGCPDAGATAPSNKAATKAMARGRQFILTGPADWLF
jgi:hypothetical protein